MKRFAREDLLRSDGSHITSEPHVRMHVTSVTQEHPSDLFENYHGELLLIVLKGRCAVVSSTEQHHLNQGDQALLVDGEAFGLRTDEDEALVQFVWMPGVNPCETCWTNYSRHFNAS
jgi:homogentisate 1,2-dioxygenase